LIAAVAGVLPAAIAANGRGQGLICPSVCGSESACASPEIKIVAIAYSDRLPLQGHSGLCTPAAKNSRAKQCLARSCRHKGPGREARARGCWLLPHAETDDREAVLSAGLDGLLIKSLDRERLREALSTASARVFDPLAAW